MGLLGAQIGKIAGGGLGGAIGQRFGGSTGQKIGSELGSVLGSAGGAMLPFKQGGIVKPPRGKKTQKAILHKGELVVPASMVKDVPKTLKKKIAKKGGRNMKKTK